MQGALRPLKIFLRVLRNCEGAVRIESRLRFNLLFARAGAHTLVGQ